jgi:hypothetical protein
MHFDYSSFDLTVVEIDPGVLKRVPDALLKVVPIASSSIGGIKMQFRLQRT